MNTEQRLTSAAYDLNQAADALLGISEQASRELIIAQCRDAGQKLKRAAASLNDHMITFEKPL